MSGPDPAESTPNYLFLHHNTIYFFTTTFILLHHTCDIILPLFFFVTENFIVKFRLYFTIVSATLPLVIIYT